MNHWKIAGAAALGAALSLSNTATAQNIINSNSRGQAIALVGGGGAGIWGGGGRVDIEYQMHFNRRYEGLGIGVGVTLPLWAGFGIGAEGRIIYDWQPISNVAFFVTPYGGLSAGFWSWTYGCGAGGPCAGASWFWLGLEAGLELKVVLFDRLMLGLRPVGLSVPFLIGNGFNAGFGYHGGGTIGVTF